MHEAQRPAHGLQLEHELVAALGVADEARGQAVVARRAALAQRFDRRVGGFGVLLGRLVVLLAPVRAHALGRPVAAGEDRYRVHAPTR